MSHRDINYIQKMEKKLKEMEGAQDMVSKLQEYRHDNQNPASALLEAIDNSVDWGKANSITIVKTNSAIFVYDNGHVDDDRKRFSEWLILGKKNNKVHGSDAIGKFGLGLPKGGCLLGNKMSVIASIDGIITTTQCDWERMSRNNNHTPTVRDSTPEEVQEFEDKYGNNGVLVKYENLFEVSKELSIEYIHDITCAQFLHNYKNSPKIKLIRVFDNGHENKEIQIHDFVDTTCWKSTLDKYRKECALVKLQNKKDIAANRTVRTKFCIEQVDKGETIQYFVDKDGSKYEVDSNQYEEAYRCKVKMTAIDDKFDANGSQKFYKNKQNCELIGAKIYRQNRDITPLTSLSLGNSCSPDKGGYRSRCSRIAICFDTKSHSEDDKMKICSEFDIDFGVTSLKNITNEAFSSYNTEGLKECLKYIGSEASRLNEIKKRDQKEEAQDEIKEKIRIINEEPQSISKEKCEEFIKTFNRLYEEGEYQPDNEDYKEPFNFDGRNGLFKQFIKTDYKDIMKNLELILENLNKTYEEMNVESADESMDKEEHVNLSINKSTQQEQVNQLPEEYIQPEQVNESSDNPIQLESTTLSSSSDDDSSSSSEEDYSSSDESEIETAQVDDSNIEETKQYSAEQLLTPENFESENTVNEYSHDSSSAEASILNDIKINEYMKKFKETICDRLDFSNPEHRTLIDEFSQKLNQTSYSLEVGNSI